MSLKSAMALCLLTISSVCSAQSITVPVDDTIFLYGVPYHAVGTLTLTPINTTGTMVAPIPMPTTIPTPTPTPTPVTPTPVTPPVIVPTPTPVVPTTGVPSSGTFITGIRNVATGQFVTTATKGTLLVVEGGGFGTSGRLQLGGKIEATPMLWSDAKITFTAPDPGPLPITGGWDVFLPNGHQLILGATTGSFTLSE